MRVLDVDFITLTLNANPRTFSQGFVKPFIWILLVLGKVIVALHHSWLRNIFQQLKV